MKKIIAFLLAMAMLLSLAVFGRLFGFWGLLFAVPLGALCKNFLFWLYERKRI